MYKRHKKGVFPMARTDIARLQVRMSKKALEDLDKLQKRIDASTRTQVIKSSLRVFRFLEEEKGRGAHIIIKDKNGKERELIL